MGVHSLRRRPTDTRKQPTSDNSRAVFFWASRSLENGLLSVGFNATDFQVFAIIAKTTQLSAKREADFWVL